MTLPLLAFTMALALMQTATTPAPPAAREIAPETLLIPGAMLPNRGPDGNTVIFSGPGGLIVVDTGRHPWHSDGILAVARDRKQPIAVIVNTHWHLDHSSGNRRLKAAHPQARVYTTRAVDRALAPGGFIERNIAAVRKQPIDPKMNPTRREETELFIATMETPDSLRPDVPVEQSGTMTLAGRPLSVRVAADAVTDADVWLYDEKTGVAVIGDLVTLPAPFFETACPARWEAALDEVWATPFRAAVPGHGPVMTRADFDAYRKAFGSFRTCVGSDSAAATCAAGWTKDVSSLLASEAEQKQAAEYATYYVDFLRKGGGASADCRVK
jgi:glyoxylase-like metal-dependent hydrolase (beta-lactamase superfamily II)